MPFFCLSEAAETPLEEKNAFTLAKGLYNDGLYDLSAKQFNLFIKDYPNSKLIPDAYFYSAEGLYKTENYKETVLMYGKILEMFPDFSKLDNVIKGVAECSKYIEEGEAVIKAFEIIFERYPEKGYSSGAAYYYASLLYKRQRFNESLWIFERLTEKIPADVPEDELYYKLGECLYRTGDFRSASEKWFHVIKKYPKSNLAEMSLYSLGVLYFVEGDYKESRVRFEKMIKSYPESNLYKRAMYGVVWSLWKEGMYEDAAQYLIAYEKREGVEEREIVSAVELFNKNDFAGAYNKFKKILQEKPDIGFIEEILWLMVKSVEENGDLKESLEIYLRLIKEFPESHRIGEAYINAGKIYLDLKDLNSAANILKTYTEKYPSPNSAFSKSGGIGDLLDIIQRADNYLKSGEDDKAVGLYKELFKDTFEPLLKLLIKNKLRDVYLKKSMYKEYIELSSYFMDYEPMVLEEKKENFITKNTETSEKYKKIDISPVSSVAEGSGAISLYMTADMLVKSGRNDKASEIFRKIINDYPDEKEMDDERLNIGLFFLKEKEYDLSIKSFTQVINRTEDNKIKAEVHFWLGEALQNSGRLEDAILEYLKIAYLYPENDLWSGTARFRAGEILEMKGRLDEAVIMYQQLASKYKNDERGKFAKKRLEDIKKLRNKEQKPD